MIGKLSTQTLIKVAVYGGASSVIASSVMYYLMLKQLCSGPYFTMAVSVFKEDKRICDFLGQPIKVKRLKLGNKENRISEEDAEISIPVVGSKRSGVLKARASVRNGKWELDSLTFQYKDKSIKVHLD